jgi:DNA-binding Xre family transcriptional regulator
MSKTTNPRHGSNFDDFLREEGLLEAVEAAALKKVIAVALATTMKRKHVSVATLARRLGTSRAAVNRVLDEQNTSITLHTLTRAASAVGCRLKLEIVAA